MKHIKAIEMEEATIIANSITHDDADDHAQEAHGVPFLIFFGITCALIGAIAYKYIGILI